jgi:phosphatidylglycerophosphatase C
VKKGLAFFDFDGTITTKDTFLEFIRFSKGGWQLYWGLILNIFYLVGFKLKLIPHQKAKEKVLQFFFEGTPVSEFKKQCELFSKQVLPKLVRPKAVEEIKKLQKEGTIVVVVSASAENWIENWAQHLGVELIGSRLKIEDGKIAGKLIGENCRGKEKVRRILEKYTVSDFTDVYAYGDSTGDSDMLKLARYAYYKPFRK